MEQWQLVTTAKTKNDCTALDLNIYYSNNVSFVEFQNQPLGVNEPLEKQNKTKTKIR
jgi:hypothetical protein